MGHARGLNKQMIPDHPLFHGLTFFDGAEHLPADLPVSLEAIRQWALQSGLIFDDAQLLTGDRVADIAKVCSPNDRLTIAVAVTGATDVLNYLEYPYMPVQSLIRRGQQVAVVYWKLASLHRAGDDRPPRFGEVRFGFWISGCNDEFCSMSTAPRVVAKFAQAFERVADPPEAYMVKTDPDGSKELTVDGSVHARFFKDGRLFDVDLSYERGLSINLEVQQ